MRNFEVTFIVDPVLSGDEIKSTAKTYEDLLINEDCSIVYKNEMGLKQLAYPINKRNSGVYYCIEYKTENMSIVPRLELALKRDERIMRFLSINLDKFGVKYNEDKRNGLIGKKERPKSTKDEQKNVAPKVHPQDLTKIEGVGPKIAQLLNGAGILTYLDLSKATVAEIKDIFDKAGSMYATHDPSSWAEQATLAHQTKWNDLATLQDKLKGGVAVSSEEE